jgi:hypothetical protein
MKNIAWSGLLLCFAIGCTPSETGSLTGSGGSEGTGTGGASAGSGG